MFSYIYFSGSDNLGKTQLEIYRWYDPIAFVEYVRSGKITKEEKELIESTKQEYLFPKDVLNVLLKLILDINENKLHPAIIESIASKWEKYKINDFDQAVHEANNLRSFLTHRKQRLHFKCNHCDERFIVFQHKAKNCPICSSINIVIEH